MARRKAKALPPKMISVYAEILQETDDGLLVRCDEEADGVWLPKSQINYDGERGDTGVEIEIPDWLADEKGFFDGMGKSEATPIGEAIGAVVDGLKPPQPEPVTLHGSRIRMDDTENGPVVIFAVTDPDADEFSETEYTFLESEIISSTEDDDGYDTLTVPHAYAVTLGLAQPVEDAAEPPAGKRAFGDNVKWLKEERITVSTPLTETERAKYADEMSALDMEIESLKDERAEISNRLKKQIDAKEEERLAMSRVVSDGELRETLCDCLKDYSAGEMVWTEAYPPYAEILRRKMTPEEMQPSLLEYSEKVAAAAPSDGVDFDADTAGSLFDDDTNGPPESDAADAPAGDSADEDASADEPETEPQEAA